jgi:hypothetical protein
MIIELKVVFGANFFILRRRPLYPMKSKSCHPWFDESVRIVRGEEQFERLAVKQFPPLHDMLSLMVPNTALRRLVVNVVPSTSIRCMMTASLRARATVAFFIPARLAIRVAQLLRAVAALNRLGDATTCSPFAECDGRPPPLAPDSSRESRFRLV